jgi:hypoxanthine phosphoribosyltransferase
MTDAAGGELTASASVPTTSDAEVSAPPSPPFAHGSEAEMARILDFYGVRWEYEPRTFPILWNLEGDVVESFSPDFYLPDLELFLEMTTLKQRLVRKKNRKLRRLRELYPDIRIKLFYARDFRAMLLKYGRLALADSLSGTLGQVMPERPPEPEPDDIAGADADDLQTAAQTASPIGSPAPGPALRRSASRSRRRRAAAAARSAARTAGPVTAIADHDEEDRGPR